MNEEKTENQNTEEEEASKKILDEGLGKDLEPKLKKELEEALEKKAAFEKDAAFYKDQFLRKAAEFENYKKRTENDTINLIKFAAESLIVNLLPVYNDLDRSIKHLEETDNIDSLKEGIKLVFGKFTKVLEDQGVRKMESMGKPFDFNFHEALMQREEKGVQPHTVVEVVEPGYLYKDKVIVHAKVIVSQESKDPGEVNIEDKGVKQ